MCPPACEVLFGISSCKALIETPAVWSHGAGVEALDPLCRKEFAPGGLRLLSLQGPAVGLALAGIQELHWQTMSYNHERYHTR